MGWKKSLLVIIILSAALTIIFAIIFIISPSFFDLYRRIYEPKSECSLPAPFECSLWELHAGTGELDLRAFNYDGIDENGQHIWKNIQINGLLCTQNNSTQYLKEAQINNYAKDPIPMDYGYAEALSESSSYHVVRCTDAEGGPLTNTNDGSWYNGVIYINYTEISGGSYDKMKGEYTNYTYNASISKIAVGTLSTKFGLRGYIT